MSDESHDPEMAGLQQLTRLYENYIGLIKANLMEIEGQNIGKYLEYLDEMDKFREDLNLEHLTIHTLSTADKKIRQEVLSDENAEKLKNFKDEINPDAAMQSFFLMDYLTGEENLPKRMEEFGKYVSDSLGADYFI